MEVQRIKDHIHACTEFEGANVACINTDLGVVLVDTPMLPNDIEQWKKYVLDLNPKGVRYIISTHHHFDHVLGHHRFEGAVIMHERSIGEMIRDGGALKETMMAMAPPALTREDLDYMASAPPVSPEIEMGDALTLNLGDCRIRMLHIPGHTPDSICVYLPEDRVLITGDTLPANRHPYKGHANFSDWIKSLGRMNELDVETIIPGHGEVCGRDEMARCREYFHRLWFMLSLIHI